MTLAEKLTDPSVEPDAPSADLFMSYAHSDRLIAEAVATALSGEGHTVWVDKQALRDGDTFDTQIEFAIANAKVVIVLWSTASVKSRWVRAEAAYALAKQKLLPIVLDGAEPPLEFIHTQSIDFYGWDGSPTSTQFRRLIGSISARLKRTGAADLTNRAATWRPRRLLDRALHHLHLLFDPESESNFKMYYRERVYSAAQFAILAGLLTYLAFGISDVVGIGGGVNSTRFRFAVVCPSLTLFYALSFTAWARTRFEPFMLAFAVVAGTYIFCTTLLLNASSGTLFSYSSGFGTMNYLLGVMFIPLTQLRTAQTALVSAYFLILHSIYIELVARLSTPYLLMDTGFVLTCSIAACCIAYWREQSHRKVFVARGLA